MSNTTFYRYRTTPAYLGKGYREVTDAEYKIGLPPDAEVWWAGHWQPRSRYRTGDPGIDPHAYRTKTPAPSLTTDH